VRIFPCVLQDSREAARSLPFDSWNEEDRKRSPLGVPELVGFLLHPISRSETRRRLKQLHVNCGQSPLARSEKTGPNSPGERVDLEETIANRQHKNYTRKSFLSQPQKLRETVDKVLIFNMLNGRILLRIA
jgi:hypothetical protein